MNLVANISHCIVKGVRADMVKNRVTITLETTLDEEMMITKRHLALMALDETRLTVTITEQQMSFKMRVSPMNIPEIPEHD